MKDISRYTLEQVKDSLEEAGFTEEQMYKALAEFDYDSFPSNGLTDKGYRILRKRIGQIDDAEANLKKIRKTKKKELSDEVSQGKPDWKQWLPVYGRFQESLDEERGKSTIRERYSEIIIGLYDSYQLVATLSFIVGLYELLNRIPY